MSSIPLPALGIKPPESVLDTYSKILQLQNQRAQQALIPGQQQLQQGQIVGQQQQNQVGANQVKLSDIQVKDQQLLSQLYPQFTQKTPVSDGKTTPETGPTGYDFDGLKEEYIKQGGSMAGLSQINGIQSANAALATKLAGAGEATIKQQQAANSAMNDAIETLQAIPDPQGRTQALGPIVANLQKMGIDTSKIAQQPPTDDNLAKAQAGLGMHQQVISDAAKLADLAKTTSDVQKTQLELQTPTQQQRDTFTGKTLPSFSNMTPAQRASFAQQASQARTVPEFNKVVEAADTTDKSMQLHADSLAQTRALVGNKFGEAGLTANEKVWNDPQRGFAGALQQANQTKASIVAGADGNGLLTALAPTMEVLGINHAAGISRISPAEAAAAGTPPEFATRWNAWASKAASGKITPELAKQGQQLMDVVIQAAHTRAIQGSELVAKGHNLDPSQVPAMDIKGNVTTLDKVAGQGGAQQGGGQASGGAPPKLQVGQQVSIKGKPMTITAVHPDGTFDAK